MNIQPNSAITSLAGTARAQVHGDAERRSPSADAAADPRLSAVSGIEAGTTSEDRDADGRQLLEKREHHGSSNSSRDENSCNSDAAEDPAGGAANALPPPASDGAVTHIDFEA